MLLTYPLAIAAFYRRLVGAFGGRFVLVVFAIYGLSQGIGQSFAYYAQKYLFTDDVPEGFGRTAAAYQAYDGLSIFPWSCKALYGLVLDTVPIGGRSRTPYVEIAGVLSLAAFAGLAATGPAGTPLIACLLMLIANLSMAVPDVMLDAVVAGHCRTHPKLASDLQVGAPCTAHARTMHTPCMHVHLLGAPCVWQRGGGGSARGSRADEARELLAHVLLAHVPVVQFPYLGGEGPPRGRSALPHAWGLDEPRAWPHPCKCSLVVEPP